MSTHTSSNNQPDSDRAFVKEALERGDPTGWFDEVYVRADGQTSAVPWANAGPRLPIARWLEENDVQGVGKKALVVACGLGDDAEALAVRGFDVTAFDIAPTAIQWAKSRFPASEIRFVVGDMFHPPDEWINGFDFVLESFTVQALPIEMRHQSVAAVTQFLKRGGELLVVTLGVSSTAKRSGPPWPLTREELNLFRNHDLTEVEFREFPPAPNREAELWRALYRRK